MDLFSQYGKEIVSLLVPFIAWFLNVGIRAKAKLRWASPHSFTFLIQEPLQKDGVIVKSTQTVCTASIRVINSGRLTANKLELVFNWKPGYVNLWPVRNYTEKTDINNRYILMFENLSPKEEIGLEVMSINQDLPDLLLVRSAECEAQRVSLMWYQQVASWKIALIRLCIFVGLSTIVYGSIFALQFLILKTPFNP